MGYGVEIYFVIHFAILFSILLDVFNAPKFIRNVVLVGWMIFLVLFGGLRWQCGNDWDQYYWHFRQSSFSNVFSYYRSRTTMLEPGFVFFNAAIKGLFSTFWAYNLITGGIIQFIRYRVSKVLCGDMALSCFCMLTLLSTNYFAKRAELAMGISLLAYVYIKKHCITKFSLVNVCSYSLHHQGILMVPFYWAGKIKLNSIVFMSVMFSLTVFASLFQTKIVSLVLLIGGSAGDIGASALHYATEFETVSDGSRIRGISTIALNIFFSALFLYVRYKEKLEKDEWYNLLLNMFLLQTSIYMIFSDGMSDLCRLGELFILAKIILILKVSEYFKVHGPKLYYVLFMIFLLGYLFSKVLSLDSGYFFYLANVPYRTIFDFFVL